MKTIYCASAVFHAQKDDARLHNIAALARIANSLRFARTAAHDRFGDSTPAASRQRASAFFYVCGLLFEALRFADRLGKYFGASQAFQVCFRPLLRDSGIKKLRRGVLSRLRNKALYHHDDSVFSRGLSLLQENELVFTTADGDKPSDMCYDMADVAVLRFALDSSSPTVQFQEEVTTLMIEVVSAAERFCVSADTLIRETLVELGWQYPQRNS